MTDCKVCGGEMDEWGCTAGDRHTFAASKLVAEELKELRGIASELASLYGVSGEDRAVPAKLIRRAYDWRERK